VTVTVVTTRGDVRSFATGRAAVEMESGSLVIAEEANEKDEARTLGIFARGEWAYAELRDDTPGDAAP
jgi:hypothetical protein